MRFAWLELAGLAGVPSGSSRGSARPGAGRTALGGAGVSRDGHIYLLMGARQTARRVLKTARRGDRGRENVAGIISRHAMAETRVMGQGDPPAEIEMLTMLTPDHATVRSR